MSTTNRISQIRLEGPKSKSTRSSWPSNKQQSESLNCKITKNETRRFLQIYDQCGCPKSTTKRQKLKKSKTGYPSDIFFYYFLNLGEFLASFSAIDLAPSWRHEREVLKNDKQWDPPTTPFVSRENTHVIWIVGLVTSLDLAANTLTVSYSSFWP